MHSNHSLIICTFIFLSSYFKVSTNLNFKSKKWWLDKHKLFENMDIKLIK